MDENVAGIDQVNILMNGELGREIACKKGLRQGNSLFPLLFILVADWLNAIIQETVSNSM